jgi:hypothetical protein
VAWKDSRRTLKKKKPARQRRKKVAGKKKAPPVSHIDGRHRILAMLDKLRKRVEAGEVDSLAYASADSEGAVSYSYELKTVGGDRHLLCAAISILHHRFLDGYERK